MGHALERKSQNHPTFVGYQACSAVPQQKAAVLNLPQAHNSSHLPFHWSRRAYRRDSISGVAYTSPFLYPVAFGRPSIHMRINIQQELIAADELTVDEWHLITPFPLSRRDLAPS